SGIGMTPSSITGNCVAGTYPPITITNYGPSNAPWIAYSSDFSIRLTPDQGKLLAGQTQIITISGGTSNTGFQIGLFQGGSQTVTVTCG
ncbi:MAG TPA: hypothetical protein VIG30_05410, partial [Ktedonobacterales bacterium]